MVFRQQNPAARTQMPLETAEGGNRGRWVFRGVALALAVLLLGANVAPATCAATAIRWLGVSASRMSGDCCGGVARPAGSSEDTLSDDSEGCCCPPGGLAALPGTPGGLKRRRPRVLPGPGSRSRPGRDVDQDLGSARQNLGTPARGQAGGGHLFLRIGVLRI